FHRRDLTQQREAEVVDLRDEREVVTREHRLDRIEMVVAHPTREEIRIGGTIVAHVPEHELRDGFVGARVIEDYDLPEIEYGEAAVAELDDLALDAEPQCATGRTCHQVRVQAGDGPTHE